jgi:hypothetical protein
MARPVVMAITNPASPTAEAYGELQTAYEFFNRELFGGELPSCLITLQRKGRFAGFYSHKQFRNQAEQHTDEIAINPRHLNAPFEDVMSTLVHEMVHLWQCHFGKPSRHGYHNREWAERMRYLGLRPTHNGEPDGDMTGQRITNIIVAGERFAVACAKLKDTGLVVTWHDKDPLPPEPSPEAILRMKAETEKDHSIRLAVIEAAKARCAEIEAEEAQRQAEHDVEDEALKTAKGKSGKRTVYRFGGCGDKAEGKATLALQCLKCDRRLVRERMR